MTKALFETMLAIVILTGFTVCAHAQDEKQRRQRLPTTQQQQQQDQKQQQSNAEAAKGEAAAAPVACPGLMLPKPPKMIRDGDQAILGVNLLAEFKGPLVYIWTISGGSFIGGQGTKSIAVDTTGASVDKGFTATVQISGLPAECVAEATTTVYVAGPAKKLDEYVHTTDEDEQARLDNLITNVTDKDQAVIFVYAGRTSPRGQAFADIKRIRAYLTQRAAARERFVTIDAGFREKPAYELWIVPLGAENPKPTPTIPAKDIVYPKTTLLKKP